MSVDWATLVDPSPSFAPCPDKEFDIDLDLDFDLDSLLNVNPDFDLILDDLYLPSENESFLIPCSDSFENRSPDDCVPVDREGDGKEAQGGFPDRAMSSAVVSSQGSGGDGGWGSGLSVDTDSPSPFSGNVDRDRDVSSDILPEQKVKFEVSGNKGNNDGLSGLMKRKKDDVDASEEVRMPKFRKSVVKADENVRSVEKVETLKGDEEEKRKARLIRNRESAQLSRMRKKHYVEEMEEKIRIMQTTITDLNGKISCMMAENISLRQQLTSATTGAMCAPPPVMAPLLPGMYSHPAVPYPWVPCAPYMVKPQGSQVPLVPIPRLKPQQPATSSSAKVKKGDTKKFQPKDTRKVASISLLGVLFFMLMFGVLVPNVKVGYDGNGVVVPVRSGYFGDRYRSEHFRKARILSVSGHSNVSYHKTRAGSGSGSEEWPTHYRNGSEPLVASLYVPRNNKLMKIDGNLIIHSVLVSEKAMASQALRETDDEAMRKNVASALAIPDSRIKLAPYHVYGKPMEQQKALGSGERETLNDHAKTNSSANGKLQQWFREGLAGPLMSSGMCTEVFRFDVSPASSGAIVPASPASNITSVDHRNATSELTGKNRRILGRLPHRITGSGTNITERGSVKGEEDLPVNKTLSSSMVVSVLIDPREAGDGNIDMDGVIRPQSISRIFVVVLMDSIKYVTYSCMLPRSSPGTHFVIA